MKEPKKRFPPGLDYAIAHDTTPFVRESIADLSRTLLIAIGLVALVVLVFLQSWRASLVPILAIPVSLIGSFAAMWVAGFSLNMLTLFGLVLAIGIVVDDAIVVVENVERWIEEGHSPASGVPRDGRGNAGGYRNRLRPLRSVRSRRLHSAVSPGAFIGNSRLTIAFSTLLSAFNSLTLSPALSALLLKPQRSQATGLPRRSIRCSDDSSAFNRGFEITNRWYISALHQVVRHAVGLVVYVGLP